MAIHLPTDRAELETLALHSCSTNELSELKNSIQGADDIKLHAIIINRDDSLEAPTGDAFIDIVQPAFQKLLFMERRFRLLDTPTWSYSSAMDEICKIHDQEQRVLLAWVHAEKNISPELAAYVESGKMLFTNEIEDYFYRLFVSN